MMKPSEPNLCPECGQPVPVASQHQVCPSCLLRQALDSGTLVDGAPGAHGASVAAPPPSPEEIAEQFPPFEITECLGRGGMGVVYKARQKSLDRWVAIKILPPERVGEGEFAARFAREAATLAMLSHPNIVTIHDFGETGGLFFIVMEYVDGVNLRDLLREGKLDPKQALAIVPPICEALQYAHDKGVVHRDIKPENILLDRDGRIKIADFGIAALIGAGGDNIGTPPYMAPEQAGAAPTVDHRADIYALGVVFYEMLTGERPNKDLVAPSKKVRIDVRLDEMVLRALEKEPERRYQTAGEFGTIVETIAGAVPGDPNMASSGLVKAERARLTVVESPASEPMRGDAPPRGMFRRWWWVLLVMIPVGMLLGLAVGGVWSYIAPKKYEASTKILCKPDPAADVPATKEQVQKGIMTGLRSAETLARLEARLELGKRWAMPTEDAIRALGGIVTVDAIRGTDLVRVNVRSKNPEECREIANEVLKTYQASPGINMVVVQAASLPQRPVAPNVPLILTVSTALGIPLGLLLALPLMALLQRFLPERVAAATAPAMPAPRPLADPVRSGPPALPSPNAASPAGSAPGFGKSANISTRQPSLVPAVVLHAVLFAGVAALFLVVVPHYATMFRDVAVPLPAITRFVMAPPPNWVILGLPILLGLDVGCCYLARQLGGRRGLFWWTIGVIAGLALMGVVASASIIIPLRKMVVKLKPETSSQSAVPSAPSVPPAAVPDERSERVAVEDLALHLLVAIREKDDAKLKSLASDRIKGWPDALPVFAVELREHFRQFTGNESFDLRASESLVKGELAVVKCTGPETLKGMCLVLNFVKTADGWRNHSLRNSTGQTPLAEHLANLQKEIRNEKQLQHPAPRPAVEKDSGPVEQ